MIKLNSAWSFWYHSSKVKNWDRDSYNFIYKTQYAEEFWGIFKELSLKHYESGIIFIMREDIFPIGQVLKIRMVDLYQLRLKLNQKIIKLTILPKLGLKD